jgi:hypothetical protein
VAEYQRKASGVLARLSHPRCAAQLTTAGAVIDRNPLTHPIKKACRIAGNITA